MEPKYPDGDHPRSCGEQTEPERGKLQDLGSPPLMRGTVLATQVQLKFLEDHPRSCGEQFAILHTVWACSGSPPLMRGTVEVKSIPGAGLRITPAHAGNSM